MKLIINFPEDRYKKLKEYFANDACCGLQSDLAIAKGIPLEDIINGIESHKWGHNEGSKEIYNNAIDDVLTYIEEKLGGKQ